MTDPITKTLREMLHQRGYSIDEENKENIFATKPCGNKVCVFLGVEPKLNVESFKSHVERLNKLKIHHGIIVFQEITPSTNKHIRDTAELKLTIETFYDRELMCNITKHSLVPKHIKLSDDDAETFKKKWGTKFPVLSHSDPVAKFYAFKKGDIVEVTRRNGYITHRIVR